MIDEKLLIEEIEKIKQQRLEIIPNHDHYESEYMCIFNIFENIKKIIESQPKANQWIAVSERLPKEHGWYLVQYSKELLGGLIIEVVGYDERGFLGSLSDVLAWMPLPNPYQEEEND